MTNQKNQRHENLVRQWHLDAPCHMSIQTLAERITDSNSLVLDEYAPDQGTIHASTKPQFSSWGEAIDIWCTRVDSGIRISATISEKYDTFGVRWIRQLHRLKVAHQLDNFINSAATG